MIYYNPFKQFLKNILNFLLSLFTKKFLLMIIVILVILLLHLNVNAVTYTDDLTTELTTTQEQYQNDLILQIIPHYLNNDSNWNDLIKPLFDKILDYSLSVYVPDSFGPANGTPSSSNSVVNDLYLYYPNAWFFSNFTNAEFRNINYTSKITGQTQSLEYVYFKGGATGGAQYTFDISRFYLNNSTHNIDRVSTTYNTSGYVPRVVADYKSKLMLDFLTYYEGWRSGSTEQINYTSILNDIESYVKSLDTSNTNIYNTLQSILSVLNTIANKTENDYTSQISGINSQVSNLNNSIQTQTQQQHQDAQATQNAINNQTQQQHEDAQATQNTIEESTNSILSTDADEITLDDFGVSSPVIEGSPDLTNIFDLVYNSFMSVYEDNIYRIQFKLPSGNTTYNYDIPADALSSKIPDELKTLISVFWWVVLGGAVIRFIVNIIHQIVTYSNGGGDSSKGGFLSELTMTPTEFVLFNILH